MGRHAGHLSSGTAARQAVIPPRCRTIIGARHEDEMESHTLQAFVRSETTDEVRGRPDASSPGSHARSMVDARGGPRVRRGREPILRYGSRRGGV